MGLKSPKHSDVILFEWSLQYTQGDETFFETFHHISGSGFSQYFFINTMPQIIQYILHRENIFKKSI